MSGENEHRRRHEAAHEARKLARKARATAPVAAPVVKGTAHGDCLTQLGTHISKQTANSFSFEDARI